MKGFIHVTFTCLYILVTFFGFGPVLMADGSLKERLLTAGVVLVIFSILIKLHHFLSRRFY